jgi:polyhydroxybutyrate depolymerase
VTVAAALAVPAPATAAVEAPGGSADPSGTVLHEQIRSGGRVREYRLFVPDGLSSTRRVAVVFVLHGGGGSADQVARNTRFDAQASSAGFLAVYPEGLGRSWNAGAICCGLAQRLDVDDVAFVGRLLDRLESRYRVDRRRVYAAGHSNGGMLAYRLACELAGRFAAVGAVGSALVTSPCSPSRAVSLIHIHGLEDDRVPIEGGEGVSGRVWPPVAEGIALWRDADRCGAESSLRRRGAVRERTWGDCARGTAVRLTTIAGAGHSWPGGTRGLPGDPPSPALDATASLWAFFAAHPQR